MSAVSHVKLWLSFGNPLVCTRHKQALRQPCGNVRLQFGSRLCHIPYLISLSLLLSLSTLFYLIKHLIHGKDLKHNRASQDILSHFYWQDRKQPSEPHIHINVYAKCPQSNYHPTYKLSPLLPDCWITVGLLESLQRKPSVVQRSGYDSQPSSSRALYTAFSLVTVHVPWQPSVAGEPLTRTGTAPLWLQSVLLHLSISFVRNQGDTSVPKML